MSEDNLPAPIPPDDDAPTPERERICRTFKNMLDWSLIATGTMHELMVEMIRTNRECGFNKFTTPNGRPCIIILGVGPDAVGILTDVVYQITNQDGKEEDED